MQEWIKNYKARMTEILQNKKDDITTFENQLNKEKKGKNRKSKIEKFTKKLTTAKSEYENYKTEFADINEEIGELEKSDQIYGIDIGVYEDAKGNLDNQIYYNYGNKQVMMRLNSESDNIRTNIHPPEMRFFAHELKHMYQFEKTNLNIPIYSGKGAFENDNIVPILYSQQDEKEAYNRQSFFGFAPTLAKKDLKLPLTDKYFDSFVLYSTVLKKAIKENDNDTILKYKNVLQAIADKTNSAFRILNITYAATQ
jgi:hypothetical protein